jgi:ribosome-binding factor A
VEDKEGAKEALQVLNKAVGFLRSNIAKESTMRIVPTLRFYFDESIMRGQNLSALIEHAVHEDQKNHVDVEASENDESSSDE